MSTAVARRYAEALSDLAAEQDILEKVSADLASFGSVLTDSEELSSALQNPGLSGEERLAVIGSLLEKLKIDGISRNFLSLVVENGRIGAYTEIAAAYEQRLDERLGRVRATVTSAVPLGAEMLGQIEKQIQHLTGKDSVLLTADVDPALIGGIVTRVGDMVLDGSIRTQLSTIRNQLLGQPAIGEA